MSCRIIGGGGCTSRTSKCLTILNSTSLIGCCDVRELEILSRVGNTDSQGKLTRGWCFSKDIRDLVHLGGSWVTFLLLLGGGHTADIWTSYLSNGMALYLRGGG